MKKRRDSDGPPAKASGPNGQAQSGPTENARRPTARSEEVVDILPNDDDGFVGRPTHMVPIGLYGFQHYISILGSLILIPLVIVPGMGGTYEDTSHVVSTVLFVSGVTTLLHLTFGSRLPLIQGPSFVYLALALAIINTPEFQGLNANVMTLLPIVELDPPTISMTFGDNDSPLAGCDCTHDDIEAKRPKPTQPTVKLALFRIFF